MGRPSLNGIRGNLRLQNRLLIVLVGLGLAVLPACELVNNEDSFVDLETVGNISYSRHVQPLLDRECGACHGGAAPDAGLDLTSWSGIVEGSDAGGVVVPRRADRSPLIQMLDALQPTRHPLDVTNPRAGVAPDTLTAVEIAFLKRWVDEGAKNDTGAEPYADADSLLYVAVQDDASIYQIDTRRNVVAAIVDLTDLGYSASAKPHHVVVEPDGSFWYVSLIGESKVLKFDSDNQVVGEADFETPGMLALHPSLDLLFVGRSLSAPAPPSSIGRITRSTMAIEEVQVLFPRPHALAVDPDGGFVHTASLGENQLMTVEAAGSTVSFTPVAGPAHAFVQFAVSSQRDRMYATTQLSNRVLVFDISDPANPVQDSAIPVNAAPWHPAITPDQSELWFGNNLANTITVLDLDQLTIAKVIFGNGVAGPHGSAVRGDGRYVYISNRNLNGTYSPRHDFGTNPQPGTVVVIDRTSQSIVRVIETGPYAAGMGIR